jgi:hypothetical protein
MVLVGASVALASGVGVDQTRDRVDQPTTIAPPIFAYYSVGHTAQSWWSLQGDLPILGRYSSSEQAVMRTHIRRAKAVGIEGFLVLWKNTRMHQENLAALATIAAEEDFKLGVAYDSSQLDGSRARARRVQSDLDVLSRIVADRRAFDAFGKPLVIWSDSQRYTRSQVAQTTGDRRDNLLILASESSVRGIERLAGIVDGNAFEWPSLDPQAQRGFAQKLAAMGDAVRRDGGIWIPVATPGLRPQWIGSATEVVPRRSGVTLKQRLNGAARSNPTVIGLLSWNDFPTGTHIEASHLHDSRYLDVVAQFTASPSTSDAALSTSSGALFLGDISESALLLIAFMLLVGLTMFATLRRSWQNAIHRAPPMSGKGPSIKPL